MLSALFCVWHAELGWHAEIAARNRKHDRENIRQCDDQLVWEDRVPADCLNIDCDGIGQTECKRAEHNALWVPVAQEADGKRDPAAPADDTAGEHAEIANGIK